MRALADLREGNQGARHGPPVALLVAFLFVLVFVVLVFAAAAAPSRIAPVFTGRCVGVLDGDSIEVLAGGVTHQIRASKGSTRPSAASRSRVAPSRSCRI